MKYRTVGYHLLFWLCIYALWIVVFHSYSVAITKTMTIQFCYLIFITADFYLISYFVAPRFLGRKKQALFVLFLSATIWLSALLRNLVAIQMKRHFFHDAPASSFSDLYISSFLNIAGWVMLITIGKMLIDRMQMGKQVELLEQERIKNELNFLKAQINPHALFNSLNTVYGSIDKSNSSARKILLQYSELLRYQLYDCVAEKVSLGKEIMYLKNYIAFERLRKDEGLIVKANLANINADLLIAPLMLVVLIENAFKFVSNFSNEENKICIDIRTNNSQLHCVVGNTKEYQTVNRIEFANGIGIQNLKRRLELLYPDKYEMTVSADAYFYQTNLQIELL